MDWLTTVERAISQLNEYVPLALPSSQRMVVAADMKLLSFRSRQL